MKKEQILEILSDYSPFGKKLCYGKNREKYTKEIIKSIGNKLIKVLVGFRRSGKSYIFRYLIHYLIEKQNVNPKNILFINLEDDRLFGNRNIDCLRKIYETYSEFIQTNGKIYIFLDEIQTIPSWENFIRTLYEQNNEVEIFLTGSNSDLLSSEISSSLSGRFLEFHIYPLDFKEYLFFNDIKISTKIDYIKNKIKINAYFERYLKFGGLPEILELQNDEQIKMYLKAVFNKIVIDDIVKRFHIRNVELLEIINKYLISNVGGIISYKNIINAIKSYGYNISHKTLTDYVSNIKKGFIIYDIGKFDWKIKSIFNNFKKYYVLDLGIREVEKINFDNDRSKKIENLVFLKFLQNKQKIYYGQNENQKEIDFIVACDAIFDKYQVCSVLNTANQDRKLGNFVLSNKYTNGQNFVITEQDSESINYKGININKINIITWLLDIY